MNDGMFRAKLLRMLGEDELKELIGSIAWEKIEESGFMLRVEDELPDGAMGKNKIFNLVVNDKKVTGVHKAIILLLVGVPWVWGVIKLWEAILS